MHTTSICQRRIAYCLFYDPLADDLTRALDMQPGRAEELHIAQQQETTKVTFNRHVVQSNEIEWAKTHLEFVFNLSQMPIPVQCEKSIHQTTIAC